jgi:hypothetical protein
VRATAILGRATQRSTGPACKPGSLHACGFGQSGVDFLAEPLSRARHIMTNPLAFGALQVSELLQTAAKSTTLSLVLVGDFNVGANVPPDPSFANYQALPNGGLVDA